MNAQTHPSIAVPANQISRGTDSRHRVPSGCTIESISTPEELVRLGPEWRALDAASGNGFPFRTYEWTEAWWKHLPQLRRTVSDSLFVRALRDPDGKLFAVAPLLLTERPGIGPLRIRCLQFIGPDGYITEMSGILCAQGREEEAYRELAAHLQANCDRWDWMTWSGLMPEGASGRAVQEVAPLEWLGRAPNYVLDLASSWDEFRAALPRNMKEALRKCYNAPKRAGLAFNLEIAREPAQVKEALEDFFRLHKARAGLDGTVRHKDFFKEPGTRNFLTEACSVLAQRGATRVFSLKLGSTTVAARVGFVLGDSLYLHYSGYDPAFRAYSVMTATVAEAIRSAIGEGLRFVNLSMGNDVSKTRWRPREIGYGEALQISPRGGARFWFRAYRLGYKTLHLPAVERLASRYLWRRYD
jgi:CelD/BcsL family acetyltransferase involved in cellulose biosynthesis